MNGTKSVVISALIALLISLSAIAVISLSGVPAIRLPLNTSGASPGGTTGTTTTTGPQPLGVTYNTSTSPSQPSGGRGVLSVLLTDPPHVPAGVTAIELYYGNLAVRGTSGWTALKSTGVIEVMGTVNFGDTLASASVPEGSYDAVSFDVTSVLVNYNGANYPAFFQGPQLNVNIQGNSAVTPSQPAAAIIDISPTIVNVGSGTAPKFMLWAEAQAFPVPADQVNSALEVEGHMLSLTGLAWWDNDKAMANAILKITSTSLSANSLGLTVSDIGTTGTFLKMIVVSSLNPTAGATNQNAVPSDVTGSAVFVVLGNGTLVQFLPMLHMSMPYVRGENQSLVFETLLNAGYNLSTGGSVHLSYSGQIALSFGLLVSPSVIVSGSTYWVTVIGDDTVATTQVTAS